MKPIKAVCQRWRGLIACHLLIFVSYGRELKITFMFICLYISYFLYLRVCLQMGQMKTPKKEEQWLDVCIVSATASYLTDYGNMVICELISVCLFLSMPQFICSVPGQWPKITWQSDQSCIWCWQHSYFCIEMDEPQCKNKTEY